MADADGLDDNPDHSSIPDHPSTPVSKNTRLRAKQASTDVAETLHSTDTSGQPLPHAPQIESPGAEQPPGKPDPSHVLDLLTIAVQGTTDEADWAMRQLQPLYQEQQGDEEVDALDAPTPAAEHSSETEADAEDSPIASAGNDTKMEENKEEQDLGKTTTAEATAESEARVTHVEGAGEMTHVATVTTANRFAILSEESHNSLSPPGHEGQTSGHTDPAQNQSMTSLDSCHDQAGQVDNARHRVDTPPTCRTPDKGNTQAMTEKGREAISPHSLNILGNEPCQRTILFKPTKGRFSERNRVAVAEALMSIGGEGAVKTRINTRLNVAAIDVVDTKTARLMMSTTMVALIEVTAKDPAPQGKSTGLIHRLPAKENTEKLWRALRSETAIVAIQRLRGGRSARLHFDGERPEMVDLWGLDFPVMEETATPLQCYGCGRFGHIRAACGFPTSCPTCPKRHERGNCPMASTPKCPNCPFNHVAFNKNCPAYKREKDVVAAVRSTGCGWDEARKATAARKTHKRQDPTPPPPRTMLPSAAPPNTNAWRSERPLFTSQDFPTLDLRQPSPNAVQEIQCKQPATPTTQPRQDAETQTEASDHLPDHRQQQKASDRQQPEKISTSKDKGTSTVGKEATSTTGPTDVRRTQRKQQSSQRDTGTAVHSGNEKPAYRQTFSYRKKGARRMRPEKTGDITAATGENGASLIPDGAATVLPSPLSAVNPNSQSGEGTAIPSPTGEVTAVTAGKEFAVLGGTPAPAEDVRGMELTIRTMLAEISRLLQVLQHLINTEKYCSAKAEFSGVVVRKANRDTAVVSAYVHPSGTWSPKVIAQMRAELPGDQALIVGGDFNAHNKSWGDKTTTVRGRRLQETLDATDMEIVNNGEATYLRPGVERSVIDLTIVTAELHLRATPQPDGWGSDHAPIIVGEPPRPPSKTCTVVDWTRYRDSIATLRARGGALTTQTIAEAQREATRTVRVPINRPNPDLTWLLLRAQRRQAQRRARRTRLPEDQTIFRRLDAKFKRHGKRLAREQWALRCESLDGRGGTSSAWRMARTLANRPGPRNPITALAIKMGVPTATIVERVADALLAPPPSPQVPIRAPKGWSSFTPPGAPEMVQGQGDLCLHELQRALASLPRKRSAPGPDGVTNQALRNLDEESLPGLLDYLNEAWRSATLPPEWKTATVVPLLKPGKPAGQLNSYRPIALTSCIGKLLERMVLCRLVHHLETVGALPDCYAGFRRGRCTADAITDLVTTLEDGKARRRTTGVVFLDIASAFDAVLHTTIVNSLARLGVRGRALRYVEAFLQGREARVRAAGLFSEPRHMTKGVPQGSVLSPLLFSVALAALPRAASVGPKYVVPLQIATYADDVAIWVSDHGCRRRFVRDKLQRALNNIEYHLATLGLTLSASKTVALYNAPHHTYKYDFTLTIGGREVQTKRQATYLGLRIDDRVTWQPAVNEALRGARSTTNILRILGGTRRGTEQRMLLQMFKGLTVARILYALPLLGLTQQQWAHIERAQRVALRICLGVPRSASSRLTLREAGVNTAQNTADERAFRHLIRMRETPSTTSLLSRVASRRSHLTTILGRLDAIAGGPQQYTAPPPPSDPPVVDVRLDIRGLGPKRSVQPTVARQLAAHQCDELYRGWAQMHTDGSVRDESRTATAAAVSDDTGRSGAERLGFHASSTTAELAAIRLGLGFLDERAPDRLVMLSDSRAALGLLGKPDRAPQLAREIVSRVAELQSKNWKIVFQWLPSHCGIAGNEAADRLAARAHDDPDCPISEVPPFADARLLVKRTTRNRHPELEHGPMPQRVPKRLPRRTAAALHRLRTRSAFTPARLARWREERDSRCSGCGDVADDAHLLCTCARFDGDRTVLRTAYNDLGCPSDTVDQLLWPQGTASATERALLALATFLTHSGLRDHI